MKLPDRISPAALAVLVGALCLLHAWLAWSAGARNGPTYDEPIHIASGRAHIASGDYRFQPENGWLPQRLYGLALLDPRWDFPGPERAGKAWAYADPWALSRTWFFSEGSDPMALLARARLVSALAGAALCAAVFLWSRSLFGVAGGLFSLLLAVFCPNLLAHSGLATSDVFAALGFTLALLAWWRLLHRIDLGRAALAAAAVGFLALSKFSVLLLAPMAGLLLLFRLANAAPVRLRLGGFARRLRGSRRVAPLLLSGLAVTLGAGALIWAAYGFRYDITPRSNHPPQAWDLALITQPERVGMEMAGAPDPADFAIIRRGGLQTVVAFARDHRLLPEGWLYGLAFVARNAGARLAYFDGDYRLTGWPAFFPVAFVLKTPPGALLALAGSVALLLAGGAARRRANLHRAAPLLAGIAVYLVFAMTSRLNIGYRHLLPILPLAYVLCGGLAPAFLRRARAGAAALALLVVSQVGAAWAAAPYYLTYFNAFAGGTSGGHRYFVDSSLDWGQGLPALDHWLAENHRDEIVHLSYFGSDEPARLGRAFVRVGDDLFDHGKRPRPAPMRGGLYCIGATQYRLVYTRVRGRWSDRYENAYQKLHAWFSADSLDRDPWNGTTLREGEMGSLLLELEHLRFGRLLAHLGDRAPDAAPGGAILVFRLTDAEVWWALDPRNPPPPAGAGR